MKTLLFQCFAHNCTCCVDEIVALGSIRKPSSFWRYINIHTHRHFLLSHTYCLCNCWGYLYRFLYGILRWRCKLTSERIDKYFCSSIINHLNEHHGGPVEPDSLKSKRDLNDDKEVTPVDAQIGINRLNNRYQ